MREIKFRAKRIDSGEWVYGYLYKCDKFARIITAFAYTNEDGENESLGQYYCEAYDVDINTLSQFTGLYDKNGKEIYENDIVEWAGYTMKILWGEDCGIGYGFIWEPCGGNIDYAESMTGFIDEYEVIGNIFDNLGLLGEQQ